MCSVTCGLPPRPWMLPVGFAWLSDSSSGRFTGFLVVFFLLFSFVFFFCYLSGMRSIRLSGRLGVFFVGLVRPSFGSLRRLWAPPFHLRLRCEQGRNTFLTGSE